MRNQDKEKMRAAMRYTFKDITDNLVTDTGLSIKDALDFHYFNPNGVVPQKRALDQEIAEMVNAGIVKSGWHIAYGSFNDHYWRWFGARVNRKTPPSRIELRVAVDGAREEIAKIKAKIAEAKAAHSVEA